MGKRAKNSRFHCCLSKSMLILRIMKFDSDDTKQLPFQVEIRRKTSPPKTPNKNNYSFHNKSKEAQKNEEKLQATQESIENLKRSIENAPKAPAYVNPLQAAFKQRQDEKIAAEKRKQEAINQKLLYEQYKKRQEALRLQRESNLQNNNINHKRSIIAPRFQTNLAGRVNRPSLGSTPTTKPEGRIYNTNALGRVAPTAPKVYSTPPKKANVKFKADRKKKLLQGSSDNFDWRKHVEDDFSNETTQKNRKINKSKDKSSSSHKEMITINQDMTLSSLCRLISVPVERLARQAQDLGVDTDLHKVLDKDALFLLLDMNGFGCNIYGTQELFNDYIKINENECVEIRPPVVCVLGHVDHGKTSFLDRIRETKVVDVEAGGITQTITIYQLEQYGRAIFIDTPGHSAFKLMREIGLAATDIVILLIAADDGIKEQTTEIIKAIYKGKYINHIKIIIGITKVDKLDKTTREKNINSICGELSKHDIVPEIYGGDTKVIEISSKTGEGIQSMLNTIEATKLEMTNKLKYNAHRPAIGIIINAYLEKGIGTVGYVLLKHGVLKTGDKFISGKTSGKTRLILSPAKLKECDPTHIIKITGFDGMPKPGDDFIVINNEELMKDILLFRNKIHDLESLKNKESLTNLLNKEKIHLLIKSDTIAALESLEKALLSLSSTTLIKIFSQGVGPIIVSDVEKAIEFDVVIVGFNVKVDGEAAQMLKGKNVKCITDNVIYRILEEVTLLTKKTETISVETQVGVCEVRHIFSFNKTVVAGGRVIEGSIFHNIHHICEVIRNKVSIHKGTISSMRREKDNIKEAKLSTDVGIVFDNFNKLEVGDRIICYKITTETRVIGE